MKKIILIFVSLFVASQGFAKTTKPVNKKLVIVDSKDPEMKGIEYAKKHPNSYIMRDCPVIGNKESGLYHVPKQAKYKEMLIINKCAEKGKCEDNRQCFDTIEEAQATQVKACPVSKPNCKKDDRIMRPYSASKT